VPQSLSRLFYSEVEKHERLTSGEQRIVYDVTSGLSSTIWNQESTQSSAALEVTHKTRFNVKLYQVKILQMKSCCIVRFAAFA
jgi:hypothetical protein